MFVEKDIDFQGRELFVTGYLDEGEPTVFYFPDGSGHLGTPPSFEISEIWENDKTALSHFTDDEIERIETIILDQILD